MLTRDKINDNEVKCHAVVSEFVELEASGNLQKRRGNSNKQSRK